MDVIALNLGFHKFTMLPPPSKLLSILTQENLAVWHSLETLILSRLRITKPIKEHLPNTEQEDHQDGVMQWVYHKSV